MAVGGGAEIAGALYSAWERSGMCASGDCGDVSGGRVEGGDDDWGLVFAGACVDCHTVGAARVESYGYEWVAAAAIVVTTNGFRSDWTEEDSREMYLLLKVAYI